MSLCAIVFDFDGVIADTEKLHLRAFQEVLGKRGIDLGAQQYYDHYLGLDDAGVLRALARHCGLAVGDVRVEAMLREKAQRYAELIAGVVVLFDGVNERVRAWSRQVPLAIASGALRSEIERILRRHDLLACFAAIVSADDVARGKPAPDPYLIALDRLNAARLRRRPTPDPGLRTSDFGPRTPDVGPRTPDPGRHDRSIEPANCVAIEDSRPGIEAARAAGMRTVAVTTNHPADALSSADLVVASVASLDLRILVDLTS